MTRLVYNKPLLFLLLSALLCLPVKAQIFMPKDTMPEIAESKIMIIGHVFDAETMNPIAGAIIEVQTVYPRKSGKSSFNGSFAIKGLPLGVHKVVLEAKGYEFKEVHNIQLSAEKPQASLQVELNKGQNSNEDLEAIGGSALLRSQAKTPINIKIAKRDRPINDMAIVSLRSFHEEEMSRFAGNRNDPARALSAYSGMRMQDDYHNNLLVRGHQANHLQWRVEGIPMPSVGHLGGFHPNGGLANLFSPRTLQQSDVMLGAFAAEYGNVLGGVFDAQLRQAAVSKLSISGQVNSATGAEIMVEGQTRPNKNAGYFFVNYRLSQFNYLSGLLNQQIHQQHGHPAQAAQFQDLSFQAIYPTGQGNSLTLFGVAGVASQSFEGDDSLRVQANQRVQWGAAEDQRSIIGLTGVKYRLMLKEERRSHSYLETTIASTFLQEHQHRFIGEENLDTNQLQQFQNGQHSLFAGLKYHYKLDHKLSMRVGVLNETMFFNLNNEELLYLGNQSNSFQSQAKHHTHLLQAYTMFLLKPMINFKANIGVNFQWLALTNSWSVEPRLAFRWEFSPLHFFSFGYGKHSQMQRPQAYFTQDLSGQESSALTSNFNSLRPTTAHHFVIAYEYWINNEWRLHAELYHQEIGNVPVDTLHSVFSMLNYNGQQLSDLGHLVSEGEGYMQGFELSLERYFSKGYYFLASASIYTAKYSDYLGRERDLSTNNGLILNVLGGKSIPFGASQNHRFNIDVRLSYGGPRHSAVVSPLRSFSANQTVFEPSYGMNNLTDPYFSTDLKLSMQWNHPVEKKSHLVFVDILNLTNYRGQQGQYFDRQSQSVQNYLQRPILIDFGYQFQF